MLNDRAQTQSMIMWMAFLLFLAAFVVRAIGIGSIPVAGDELLSISEGKQLNNLHSLAYFLPFNLWIRLSEDTIWLHLFTIIPAALAIPVTWIWLKNLRGIKIATITAIFLLASPFAVEYAREIRFYGMYLFLTSLFLWTYVRIQFPQNGVIRNRDRILLLVAAGLTLLSHLLASLLIGLVVLHWIFCNFHRFSRRIKVLTSLIFLIAIAVLLVVLTSPQLVEKGYRFVRSVNVSYDPSALNYTGSRGLSFVTLGKLALWYESFSWGQFVYPFNLLLVLPGLILIALVGLAGLIRLARDHARWSFYLALVVSGGAIVALYLVFDPLWPAGSRDSAVPKYIIFILPIFMWVLAEGTQLLSSRIARTVFVAGIAAVQIIGLGHLYAASWSDSYKAMHIAEPVTAITQDASQTSTIVLADGRSSEILNYYLRNSGISVQDAWPENLNNKLTSNQIVFSAADDRKEVRCPLQQTLNRLANLREVYHWVNYPFFVYIFDRAAPTNTDSGFLLPRSLYGLEFADLNLPQQVTWEGKKYTIGGMFSLPTCDNELTLRVENLGVDSTGKTKALLLFSNVLQASTYDNGTVLGRLTATATDGTQFSFDIRKGYETQEWNSSCIDICRQVLTWHKRIALVGASAYPEAYSDFQAKIWGTTLNLPQPITLKSITLTTSKPDTSINIWGLFPLAEPHD